MKNIILRRKQLRSCFRSLRETRSLLRKTRVPVIRKKFAQLLRNMNNCLKISRSYESDLSMVKENNVNLARAVQNEKEYSKNLLQDKIVAESTYHELLKDHINLKKDLHNLEKVILTYDEELKNSMIPNLVKLSDDITKFKFKNDLIKKVIEPKRNGDTALPKNAYSNGINFGTNGSQPVFAVNPMIKGCVIQKPTINVRRVSIPHENRPSLFANVGISSPIMEEPEDQLETITSRSRKCKNGLRHVINLSNATVGPSIPTMAVPEIDFRNEAENVNTDINLRMEPVVRLSDVTRMLQNSSYRISEPELETPVVENRYSSPVNHQFTPELLLKRCQTPNPRNYENLPADNPMEGCSWMFQDNANNRFECTPPVSSHIDTQDWSKTCNVNIRQDKMNKQRSIAKMNSPTNAPEFTEKYESFFQDSSLPCSNFFSCNKKKESFQTRSSNAFLNESPSGAKENTFLSSTLNNSTLLKSSKKKFFTATDEPFDFITTRRKLVTSIPNTDFANSDDAHCSSTQNVENNCDPSMNIPSTLLQNCTIRQKRSSISSRSDLRNRSNTRMSCAINLPAEMEVTGSEMTEESKNCQVKKSTRRTKKKNSENNFSSIEEVPSVKKSKSTESFSIKLGDCNSSEKRSTSKKKTSKLQERKPSISDDSELSSDSNVTSSESTLYGNESSRPMRSARRKSNISYKEPSLGKKLRR